jgi:hypothetical protein
MRNADVNLRRVERIGFHHSDTITQNMEARRAGAEAAAVPAAARGRGG